MQASAQSAFFSMLSDYHHQTQPFALFGFVLGFSLMLLFLSSWPPKNRIILIGLAFLWAWNGLVLFTYMSASLAPATYALQGILFPVQGLLLGHFALSGDGPELSFESMAGKLGLAIMFTALFIYPIVGNLLGHSFPAAPVFPEPCPTTIFTFGILLGIRGKVPVHLIVIPFFWSLMGIVAVTKLGVKADAIEVVVGVACTIAILARNRNWSQNNARPAPAE